MRRLTAPLGQLLLGLVQIRCNVPEAALRLFQRIRNRQRSEKEVQHAPNAIPLPDARTVLDLMLWLDLGEHSTGPMPELINNGPRKI